MSERTVESRSRGSTDDLVTVISSALFTKFGEQSVDIARRQIATACDESFMTWLVVFDRLSRPAFRLE
jgi:hypothetical protein